MKNSILLSRAAATATVTAGACVLACLPVPFWACPLGCALQRAFVGTAAAYTPTLKGGGEDTPLNLGSSAGSSHSSGGGGASLTRTIVGLAIVILVIWGLAWVLRQIKAGRGGTGANAPDEGLSSVAALTLGSGRSVHLVRAGSDYVLLGSTDHGVAPIHRYTEEEAQEAGLLIEPRPAPGERSRLIAAAGALGAGIGRSVGQGAHASRSAFSGDDDDGRVGEWETPARSAYRSPVAGRRPDPMRMPSSGSGLLDRLRELTVRR